MTDSSIQRHEIFNVMIVFQRLPKGSNHNEVDYGSSSLLNPTVTVQMDLDRPHGRSELCHQFIGGRHLQLGRTEGQEGRATNASFLGERRETALVQCIFQEDEKLPK